MSTPANLKSSKTKQNTGPVKNTGPVSKPRHKINGVDAGMKTATCLVCGPALVQHHARDGWRCSASNTGGLRKSGTRIYRKYKTDTCAWCGFKGHPCQLDVDHINENSDDHRPENLQTLDARCHRLKTWLVKAKVPESEWMEHRRLNGAVKILVPRAGLEPALDAL